MIDDAERDCHLSCWCRNDDPDPEGGMRWEPEPVPATRPDNK